VNAYGIYLNAGSLNSIKVTLHNSGYTGWAPQDTYMNLEWVNDNDQSWNSVPASNLYATPGQADSSVQYNVRKWCVTMDPVRSNDVLLPSFSPSKSSNVVVSAWIKEDQPCTGVAYSNTKLQLSFDNNVTPINLLPTGVIIEGWQRMEATVTVPDGASKIKFKMFSQDNAMGFSVDDIRIHPYNSNMKSMVYNPVNLRLMAELDENNYASFYEYDDDGTLVRVKKETERGIQTIKEIRSAQHKAQ
jgi:hypothetical protein